MVGINQKVITHRPNVNLNHIYIKQKCREFGTKQKQVINEEV